jgi:RHS repeat-associated protein
VVTNDQYDFKGNLLSGSRRLAIEYKQQVDWLALANLTDVQQIANAAALLLESETFTGSTTYDALNRPVTLTTPDASVVRPTYNEANLLEQVNVNLRGSNILTPFVTNLDYNAKGQRELCEYGNSVRTDYAYDPDTFRLTSLKTTRANDSALLQDLSYAYDPVGNITEIQDAAQPKIFFNNAVVSASSRYVYDAMYRLTQGGGREHAAADPQPEYDYNDLPRINLPQPGDGQAMRNYIEQYQYDPVGNILRVVHQANNGNWTRRYESDSQSNRLLSTSLPGDPIAPPYSAKYGYDSHGNMTQMPHLAQIDWDFKDELHIVDLGGGGTAYYVYDAAGNRVRKVIERQGNLTEERIYLGGYEVFRQSLGNVLKLERQSLHVMDDEKRVALVETKTIDTQSPISNPQSLVRYQLDNHLGSTVLELDDVGAIISYEEYYPYGGTSHQAGRSVAEVSLKRYRYTGKERDDETGLYYHRARYYAPWLGRWISSDPGGLRDGLNLYRYASANPIRYLDPGGTQSRVPIGLVGAPTWSDFKEATESAQKWVSEVSEAAGEKYLRWEISRHEPNPITAQQAAEGATLIETGLKVLGGVALIGPSTVLAVSEAPEKIEEGAAKIHLGHQRQSWEPELEGLGEVLGALGDVASAGLLIEGGIAAARGRLAPVTPIEPAVLDEPSGAPVTSKAKAPIIGKAQQTSPGHDVTVDRIAEEYSKEPDIERVHRNSSYETMSGVKTTPRRLPDVGGVTTQGKVSSAEVPSPTDILVGKKGPSSFNRAIVNRNLKAMLQLGDKSEGFFIFGATPKQLAPFFSVLRRVLGLKG